MLRVLKRNGWKTWHLAGGVGLAALAVLLTLDAWTDILRIANKDEEASQVFLVPFVVAWLCWVRRRRIHFCRPVGFWIGPAMTLCGWLLYSTGDSFLILSFWHGGALLIVLGCLFTVLGADILRSFIPVFLTLVFLIPIPGRVRQFIAIPMQTATAKVTQRVIELGGANVERSGNLLSINNTEVAVAEACNGLRMMFALIMVSYAFSFGMPLRGYVRFIVIAASPFSAILCNVVRLVLTVWVYGNYPTASAESFHFATGWVMLLMAFLLLTGIVRLLRWAIVPVAQYTLAYD